MLNGTWRGIYCIEDANLIVSKMPYSGTCLVVGECTALGLVACVAFVGERTKRHYAQNVMHSSD